MTKIRVWTTLTLILMSATTPAVDSLHTKEIWKSMHLAYQVTLDEICGDALALRDAHAIEISVAHHEILTLEIASYPCKTKGENA